MSKLAEDQCCKYGCPGGACETCVCCTIGFCVSGHDDDEFERNATESDRERMKEAKQEVAEGKWAERYYED